MRHNIVLENILMVKLENKIAELGLASKLNPVVNYIETKMSKSRRNHTYQVCLIASALSNREQPNNFEFERKAILAAVSHDITKEENYDFHINLFSEFHFSYNTYCYPSSVLHSKSAPLFLKKYFSIDDADIAKAISFHTTGQAGMNLLSKVLYAADGLGLLDEKAAKIEMKSDLNKLCKQKAQRSLIFLASSGMPVHTDTTDFYNSII